MFINVCMYLNFHSTSIHQIIKTKIQNKLPLDPIRRISNLSLASRVKSKRWNGPTPNTVTVTLQFCCLQLLLLSYFMYIAYA